MPASANLRVALADDRGRHDAAELERVGEAKARRDEQVGRLDDDRIGPARGQQAEVAPRGQALRRGRRPEPGRRSRGGTPR